MQKSRSRRRSKASEKMIAAANAQGKAPQQRMPGNAFASEANGVSQNDAPPEDWTAKLNSDDFLKGWYNTKPNEQQ